MNILFTGCNGQLGISVMKTTPADVNLLYAASNELNMTNESAVRDSVAMHNTSVIINAAPRYYRLISAAIARFCTRRPRSQTRLESTDRENAMASKVRWKFCLTRARCSHVVVVSAEMSY